MMQVRTDVITDIILVQQPNKKQGFQINDLVQNSISKNNEQNHNIMLDLTQNLHSPDGSDKNPLENMPQTELIDQPGVETDLKE